MRGLSSGPSYGDMSDFSLEGSDEGGSSPRELGGATGAAYWKIEMQQKQANELLDDSHLDSEAGGSFPRNLSAAPYFLIIGADESNKQMRIDILGMRVATAWRAPTTAAARRASLAAPRVLTSKCD